MKIMDFEGKNVEDAKKKAADKLGLEVKDLQNVEILDEGKSGLFGFGVSRNAKIRVSVEVASIIIEDKVKSVLDNILTMMGVSYTINEFHEGESKVYIEFESEDSGLIIGKKGKNLEAIQFLLNLIINQQVGSEKKIILDIESYRAKREKILKKISLETAKKVIRTGKAISLEPMNPFERRFVHLTLQNHDKVETKSEGQGIYRKVKISLKEN